MDLLLHFQGPDLMLTEEHPGRPVPFPVVILQNALTKMVALPVEVSYTLPEALQAMNSPFAYQRMDYYHYPLGNGLRSEAIHAAWYLGKPEQARRAAEGRPGLSIRPACPAMGAAREGKAAIVRVASEVPVAAACGHR